MRKLTAHLVVDERAYPFVVVTQYIYKMKFQHISQFSAPIYSHVMYITPHTTTVVVAAVAAVVVDHLVVVVVLVSLPS